MKTIYLSLGVVLFLLSFSGTNIYSSVTTQWQVLQYGLFGMVVFMGFLAYLIVKFKAFNIKLLGTQALVVLMVFLIGALLFYVKDAGGKILILINLMLAIGFGYVLVKSVKKEVEQREALEVANKEISERKDQLQKMADSLSVTNEKLKVANDKLKVLDQAKSDFFSRASHDLRTPITGVIGYVSLLDEGSYGAVSEQQKTILQKILSVTANMRALVEDFLTAAKLEAGGMQYNFAKAKVGDICQQIVETLYPKSKDRGLDLDFKKSEEELPELTIDASRIRESISNLVDNAIKYTEKGGVTVKIERAESSNYKPVVTNSPDEKATKEIIGSVVRVTISDTGMGIPKDGINSLFSRFSRGKGEARLKTSGTGLGLYVCKGMIEDNGGKVWAESDGEGKGSRFIVELPIETPEEVLEKIEEEKSKK